MGDNFNRGLGGDRGETLVSILLATVLIAGLVLIVLPTFSNTLDNSQKNLAAPSQCRNVARNAVSVIRSNGAQTNSYRTRIGSNSAPLTDNQWFTGGDSLNPGGVQTEAGIDGPLATQRWPNFRPVVWNTGQGNFTVNTPLLINGYMNALSTIYNSNGNQACTLPEGLPITAAAGLGQLFDPALFPEDNITASIRIRPFNMATGAIQACASPLWTRPMARTEPPPAQVSGIIDMSAYQVNTGFEVEVFVHTRDPNAPGTDPDTAVCSYMERFQYDQDRTRPKSPQVSFNGQTLVAAMPHDQFQPGLHMYCRSVSTFYTRNPITGAYIVDNVVTHGPVPCDRIRACDRNATSTNVDETSGEIRRQFNLPNMCQVDMQGYSFDMAGNTSVVQTTGFWDGGTWTPTPNVNNDNNDTGGGNPGYEVGGVEVTSYAAAQELAAMKGMAVTDIVAIPEVTNPMDAAVAGLNNALNTIAATGPAVAGVVSNVAGINATTAGVNGSIQSVSVGMANPSGAAASMSSQRGAASTNVANATATKNAAQDALNTATNAMNSATTHANNIGATQSAVSQAAMQSQVDAAQAAYDAAVQAEIDAIAAQAALEAAIAAAEAEAARQAAEDDDDDP